MNWGEEILTKVEFNNINQREEKEKIAKQIYTLSLLSQRRLTAEELKSFLNESFGILENI